MVATQETIDTLEEAKAIAQRIWPQCGFKTPEEFRNEEVEE